MAAHSQNSKNDSLFDEACKVMPGGVNTSLRRIAGFPLVFTRASGATIVDADGNQYIDYHAAFGPIVLGHNFEPVTSRVMETMRSIDLLGVGVTELEIELARKICRHVPSAEKVLFSNSGSEATYSAIRLARAATGRKKIIKFQGCYHGWHDALLMNVISAPDRLGKPDPLSAGSLAETMAQTIVCQFNNLDDVEKAFAQNRGEIAAVILEPIAHNIGCVLPGPGFLQGLREITRRQDAVLVFDEVITGFRHGLGGYQKISGVTPDLTTLGKAMANGFPIAALCGKAALMDRFNTHPGGDVFFAGTFNAHPAACAAALATIEVLETQGVHEHIFRLGEKMRRGLADIVARHEVSATVAGFGSVFVLYFQQGPIESYTDLLRNDAHRFVSYRRKLNSRGIFELPMNLKRCHISFSHTDEHIERSLEAAEDAIKELRESAASHPVELTR